MPEWTTTSRVKGILGITAAITFHDASIEGAVNYANGLVNGVVGLSAASTALATDYPDVYRPGQRDIYLRRVPVVEVVSVTNAGSTLPADAYRLEPTTGLVRLAPARSSASRVACWSDVPDDVEVEYVYGWSGGPGDLDESLQRAADLIAAASFQKGKNAGLKSVRNASHGVTLDESEIPAEADAILREWTPAFFSGS